jgi:hypothetical protein
MVSPMQQRQQLYETKMASPGDSWRLLTFPDVSPSRITGVNRVTRATVAPVHMGTAINQASTREIPFHVILSNQK